MNEKRKGLFKRLLSNEYESDASDADVRRWLSEPDERGRPMRPTSPGQFDYQRPSGHVPVTRHEPGYEYPAAPARGRSEPPPEPREPAEPFKYEPTLPAPDGVDGPPKHQASWSTPFFQSVPATPPRPEPNWGRPKPPSYVRPSSGPGRPGSSSYERPGPRPSVDRPPASSFDRPPASSFDRPPSSYDRPDYGRPQPSYERPSAPPWAAEEPEDEGGVVIVDLPRGTPLEAAGIRVGDIITACNGRPTPTEDELAGVFQTLRPGQTARLTVQRGGSEMTAEIVVPS